jgi:hypothetical protein
MTAIVLAFLLLFTGHSVNHRPLWSYPVPPCLACRA